jgi:GNAT superfamily N-acetyltransferase
VRTDSNLAIRRADLGDADEVERLLREAAQWVDALGVVMWEDGELERASIDADVAAGLYVVAEAAGSVAGIVRFQLEDPFFWPDLPEGQSAFVHRLVVDRTWKGQGVSQALLAWAAARTRELGRDALRLDCDASRTKLRQLYESCGFTLHSYRHVGPYYVSRYELRVGPSALGLVP